MTSNLKTNCTRGFLCVIALEQAVLYQGIRIHLSMNIDCWRIKCLQLPEERLVNDETVAVITRYCMATSIYIRRVDKIHLIKQDIGFFS